MCAKAGSIGNRFLVPNLTPSDAVIMLIFQDDTTQLALMRGLVTEKITPSDGYIEKRYVSDISN